MFSAHAKPDSLLERVFLKGNVYSIAEGKCIVLEIKAVEPKTNVVYQFRKLCGPRDPELCRQLYPDAIRAQYGKSTIHNAVHCTDLPEDGELEVEYFFKLLCPGYKR